MSPPLASNVTRIYSACPWSAAKGEGAGGSGREERRQRVPCASGEREGEAAAEKEE